MLKPKKIIQLISALALLVILWVAFLVIQGLFARHISHHEMYIPKNAESVLKIDGENLIRTFVKEVLLEGRFEDKINRYSNFSGDSESMGMDYLSTFYVFTVEKESSVLTGILMNILDDSQSERVMKIDQEVGTGFAVKNGVGLILYDSEKSPMNLNKLNSFASSILEKKSGFDLKKLPQSTENASINYWIKQYSLNNGTKTFSNISISLLVDGTELKMKGTAHFESSINRSYPVLEKNDLSIQTQLIPSQLSDLFTNNMQHLGFALPKLTYLSGNYHYSEPSPIEGLIVLPNFDGIYSFDKIFPIRIPLIALSASGKLNSLTLKSFKIGDKTIYYKQIDPKTIYLGQSRYRVEIVDKNALFEINGDLKQLLEIRNGGIMTRFLSLSSDYNATERLLSGIKSSDFHVQDKDEKTVDLSAEIKFVDGKSAFNEALHFILDIGLFD